MASFHITDPVEHTHIQPVQLSAQERDFLDFLIYQYGDVFTEEATEFREALQEKFEDA